MSARVKFWLKLLQLRNPFSLRRTLLYDERSAQIQGEPSAHIQDESSAQRLRAMLGSWPGILSAALLIVIAVGGLIFLSQASVEVSAHGLSSSGRSQIATRIATQRASVAATAPQVVTTPNATSPATIATQIAISPLLIENPVSLASPTVIVPLPSGRTGPQIAPLAIGPLIGITATQAITELVDPALPIVAGEATPQAPIATSTPTIDLLYLLVPTATPTPTPSIIEALEQPIEQVIEQAIENPEASGGMAGIIASATAGAPALDPSPEGLPVDSGTVPDTDGEVVTEGEVVGESEIATEGEAVAEGETVDPTIAPPTPTVAVQATPDGTVRTAHVPILMYHYLSDPPAGSDAIRRDLSVSPDLFAAHLDAMQQAGYTTISLYTLLDNLTNGTPLPEKPVILTFDDGYRDNYTNAFPLIRDRGMTASFFIVTDFIDNQMADYLTWDMVREMVAAGMSIEGHGRNHVSLANKDSDYLIWQALGTYEAIEREIGVRPHFVSYPGGDFDQLTQEIFHSANYWAGLTTEQGATQSSDNLFEMPRVRVRGSTSPEELLRLLSLDW